MFGITGGSGVLGRLVIAQLRARGFPHSAFAGDVRDKLAVRSWLEATFPQHVIHLAARVAVNEVDKDPLEAFAVNVEGTINVTVEAARLEPPPWVFFASTSHVYKSGQRPLSEDDMLMPQNIYAETKLMAESAAQFVARNRPMPLCVGRIFSFYHETQRPPFLYATVIERLRRHDPTEPFVVSNGLDVRDISNAETIANLIVQLAPARTAGIVNIGSGVATSIASFVQQLGGDQVRVLADQKRPPSQLVADIARMHQALND